MSHAQISLLPYFFEPISLSCGDAGIVHEVAISLLLLKIDKNATDMRHFFITFISCIHVISCLFQSFDLYLSETKQLQYLQILLTYTSPPPAACPDVYGTPPMICFSENSRYIISYHGPIGRSMWVTPLLIHQEKGIQNQT